MDYKEFTVGTDKYNSEKLQSAMFNNIDAYAKKLHMTNKELLQFREAVGYTLLGMRDGTISLVDLNGNLIDNKGLGNSMMGLALHYMRSLINGDKGHTLSYESKAKEKYNRDLDNDFKNYFNAGKDPDEDFINSWVNLDLADTNGNRSTAKRAAAYSKMLQDKINKIKNGDYDMEGVDLNEELANLQNALTALSDGNVTDDEYAFLAKAGHNSGATSILFGKGTVTTKPSWEKELREELKELGLSQQEIEEEVANEKESRQWEREDAREERRTAHEEKLNERYAKKHEQLWKTYANSRYLGTFNRKWNLGKSSYGSAGDYLKDVLKLGYSPENKLKDWLANPNGYTGSYSNLNLLKNYLIYSYNNRKDKDYTDDENGNHILNKSVNFANGRALAFNPETRQLYEISPRNSQTLRDMLKAYWYKNNPVPTYGSTSGNIFKEGGTIKLLSGGNIDYTLEDIVNAYNNGLISKDLAELYLKQLLNGKNPSGVDSSIPDRNGLYSSSSTINIPHFDFIDNPNSNSLSLNDIKKQVALNEIAKLKSRASKSGRKLEDLLKYENYMNHKTGIVPDGFNTSDYIRLGNLANDISSIFTSYIPIYGTAVAGALGLGSMAADLIADWKDDNVSSEDMWKNLGENALVAGLGMIPGGAGKVGKIWKAAKKLAPMVLSASGAYSELTDPEVQKSLKKFTKTDNWKDITTSDWKNFMNAAKMVAFTHNTAKATSLAYNLKLKDWSLSPKLLRSFGEASFFGSDAAKAANKKMILLGSLLNLTKEAVEAKDITGKTLTLLTAEGTLKVTLKKSAYKLLNDAIKDKKNASDALSTVNETVNTWLHNNPENYFLGDTSKLKATTVTKPKELIKDLTIDKGETFKDKSLEEYFNSLFKDDTPESDAITLALTKSGLENPYEIKDKYTVKNAKEWVDSLKGKSGDDLKNAESAILKSVNEANPFYTEEVVTPNAFTTTLNEGDINMPGWVGRKFKGSPSIKLSDAVSLGDRFDEWKGDTWEAINPVVSNKLEGNSDIAKLNRSKIITARALEKAAGNSLFRGRFANNFEMANGAGPLKFGYKGDVLDKEYNEAKRTEKAVNKYGLYSKSVLDKIAKWSENGVEDTSKPWYERMNQKFESTPEGLKWASEVQRKGRDLTLSEAEEFTKRLDFEHALEHKVAKDLFTDEQLNISAREYINNDPQLLHLFDGLNEQELTLELAKLFNSDTFKDTKNSSEFFAKLKNELSNELLGDKTLKGLSKRYENLDKLSKNIVKAKEDLKDYLADNNINLDEEVSNITDSDPTKILDKRLAKIDELYSEQWKKGSFDNINKGKNKLARDKVISEIEKITDPNIKDKLLENPSLLDDIRTEFDPSASNEEVLQRLQSNTYGISGDLETAIKNRKDYNLNLKSENEFFAKDLFNDEANGLKATDVITWYNGLSGRGITKSWSKLSADEKKAWILEYINDGNTSVNPTSADAYVNNLFKEHQSKTKIYNGDDIELANDLGFDIKPRIDSLNDLKVKVEDAKYLIDTFASGHKEQLTNGDINSTIAQIKKIQGAIGDSESEIVKNIKELKKEFAEVSLSEEEAKNFTLDEQTLLDKYYTEGLDSAKNMLTNAVDNAKKVYVKPTIDLDALLKELNTGTHASTTRLLVKFAKDNGINIYDSDKFILILDSLSNDEIKAILNNPSGLDDAKATLLALLKKYSFKSGGKLAAAQKLMTLKNGGSIRKFANGGVDNMGFSNNKKDWHSSVYDNGIGTDILNRILSLSDDDLDKYISWLNTMLDRHASLYKKYGSDYSKKVNYDDDVLKYLNDYDNDVNAGYNTGINKNAILKAYESGRYSAIGHLKRTSGDNPTVGFKNDGYFGAITDDRRLLGRVSTDGADDWSDELKTAINKILGTRGYGLMLDKNNNYYKIGRIPNWSSKNNPLNTSEATSISESPDMHLGLLTLDKAKATIKSALGKLNTADLLEDVNLLLGRRGNHKASETLINSIHPVHKDPFNSHLEFLRDINSELLARKSAGILNSTAAAAKTSDASLNIATMLDAYNKGELLINLAHLKSNEQVHSDALKATANAITNAKENNDADYTNRTADLAAEFAKANYKALEITLDTKDITNRIKSKIYDLKKKDLDKRNLWLQLLSDKYKLDLDLTNDEEYNTVKKQYDDLNELYDNETDTTKKETLSKQIQDKYNYITKIRKRISQDALNNIRKGLASILGVPYLEEISDDWAKYKSGGTINELNYKVKHLNVSEFNKLIQNSIKNHLKMVDNMSKATLLAIKKAMNL